MMIFRIVLMALVFLQTISLAAQDVGVCIKGDCSKGFGLYLFPSGVRYEGQWKNSKMNGTGILTYPKGDVYKGYFRDGLKQGYGFYQWKDGSSYVGEYDKDERHGRGLFTTAKGVKYDGIFERGKFLCAVSPEYSKSAPWSKALAKTENAKQNSGPDNKDGHGVPAANPVNKVKVIYNEAELAAKEMDKKYGVRTALVIGIDKYPNNPLNNAVKDADAMGKSLMKKGFQVRFLFNPTDKELKYAIRDYGAAVKERQGVGLFYFAGHGVQYNGENYLIPANAEIGKPEDIEFEGVSLGRMLIELEYAKNSPNIVLIDACRDNAWKTNYFKERSSDLTIVGKIPTNSIIGYATSPGLPASDGDVNGLYTEELLKAIEEPGLKIEEIFKRVRKNVRERSNGKQLPIEDTQLESDFIINPK